MICIDAMRLPGKIKDSCTQTELRGKTVFVARYDVNLPDEELVLVMTPGFGHQVRRGDVAVEEN